MNEIGNIINQTIFWGVLIALFIIALIVRDTEFIVKHPVKFLLELFVFSVIPSIILAYTSVKTRNIPVKEGWFWFWLLLIKLSAFHVLLELTGSYKVLFTH